MCSALYSMRFRSFSCWMRLAANGRLSDSHYPINFVVKHPNPLVLPRRAGPEAVETCRRTSVRRPASRSLSNFSSGGNLEAVACDLVELTGIEPVTPCLQSRCSPS